MILPPGAIPPGPTMVMLAVLWSEEQSGAWASTSRITDNDIVWVLAGSGWTGLEVRRTLRALATAGLVSYDAGIVRPLIRPTS